MRDGRARSSATGSIARWTGSRFARPAAGSGAIAWARARAPARVAALVDQYGLAQHFVVVEHHLQGARRLERLAKRRVPVAGDAVVEHLALDARIELGVALDVGVHVADVECAARVGAEDVHGGDAIGVRPARTDCLRQGRQRGGGLLAMGCSARSPSGRTIRFRSPWTRLTPLRLATSADPG